MADMPVRRHGRGVLRRGARLGAKRMQAAWQAFRDDPGKETLHEWRKRTKDRVYHLQLLRQTGLVDPEELGMVKRLETALGLVRDCDLLLDRLRSRARTGLTLEQWRSLKAFAAAEKARLLEQALALAQGRKVRKVRTGGAGRQPPPLTAKGGKAKASAPADSRR